MVRIGAHSAALGSADRRYSLHMRYQPVVLAALPVVLVLGAGACGDDATAGTTEGPVESGTSGETTDEGTSTTAGPGESDSDTTGIPGQCSADAECDDGNACTVNSCAGDGECTAEAVVSNACRPQIQVDYPPRGSTIVGQPGVPVVTVTGAVTSAAAPIESLTVNDEAVAVAADGSFSVDVVSIPGGNTLDLQVRDALGAERRRVQSFLWSSEYREPEVPGEQMVPDGLAFYLSQDALDDGDSSEPADDIASVLSVALANFDIAALIDPDTPITSSAGYNVYLTGMSFGATRVSLTGIDGGLHISATLEDVDGDLYFDCTQFACELAGGDGSGGMSVTELGVSADTMIWVDAQGQVQVTVTNPVTELNADDVDIWSGNVWTNFLISIIEPFIMDGIVNDVASALNQQIETQLGPALAGALNTLEVDAFFDLPNLGGGDSIPVNLVTNFSEANFHDGEAPPDPSPPQSGDIHQRGGGYFSQDVTPYVNDGVPGRVGCAAADEQLTLPRLSEVELGLADDMINQVLYGAWRGGLLEFDVPPELVGNGGGFEAKSFVASGMLAPTASDCATPGELRAHIGDLRFDAELILFDNPMTFTAYTSMIVRLEISADGDSVSVGIPEVIEMRTELNANEDEMIAAEAVVIGALEDGLEDTLIDALGGGGLGGITLPQIDLSAQLGLEPGTAMLTLTAEGAVREPGTTVIQAHF